MTAAIKHLISKCNTRREAFNIKNRLNKWHLLLAGLTLFCCVSPVSAVPAAPKTSVVVQPDGTKITVRLRRDKWLHWRETLDGHPIVQDPRKGVWVYAKRTLGGGLAVTSSVPGKSEPPVEGFEPQRSSGEMANRADAAQRAIPLVGTARVLTFCFKREFFWTLNC
jgi:hypothetical protein